MITLFKNSKTKKQLKDYEKSNRELFNNMIVYEKTLLELMKTPSLTDRISSLIQWNRDLINADQKFSSGFQEKSSELILKEN